MFSLKTKLTLALLVTSLGAAFIVGAVAQWKLRQKFSAVVMSQSFEAFKSDVAVYFLTYGSWENAEASEPFGEFVARRHMQAGGRGGGPRGGTLAPPPPPSGPMSMPPLAARAGPGTPRRDLETPPFRFLLLDSDGRVLLPNPPHHKGEVAPPTLRDAGMPITVGDRVVAIAVPMNTPNLSERDTAYLSAMREALWLGMAVASVIALSLGLVFGRTLSRTLRRLTAALQAIAAGDLQQRVETTSRDETGILAETFNRMSADLAKSAEDLRLSNERIREQNVQLQEAVKLREDVDRIARHDLKTPLTALIGVPKLLREEGRLRPEDADLIGIVERAGYRILNMVNLSLDLYKIEQGVYRVRPQFLDIRRLLEAVLADVQPHAAAKRVTTRVTDAPGETSPIHAWAEESLCYSLLANLLKNAVEASADGATVTIDVRKDDSVVIDIHNHGAVPPTVRDRFFEKYATAGKAGGTGLGTYSARLMARVQGGDITMASSKEDGTRVSVRLPSAPATVAAGIASHTTHSMEMASAPIELPPLRVLLVDDDEYNRLVLSRYIPAPVVVDVAVNGRDAVDAAIAGQPDVILMDVEMPGMNGLEATRQIREREHALGRRPCMIIALSSHDDEATRQSSYEIGCDVYLSKPVTRTALLSVLKEFPRSRGISRPAAGGGVAPENIVNVDPDLKDVLPAFIESRRDVLVVMAQMLEAGDLVELRRLAHRLAGSLGLYGFEWASDQARRLEIEAPNGDRAEMAALLTVLKHHLDTLEIRCGGDTVIAGASLYS
jgi:signal transduction histidine kinase/DNA-binding response OmpR family regulator